MFSMLKGWLAIAGAVIVGLCVTWFRGKRSGRREADYEQLEADRQLHERYDQVDNRPADYRAAVKRLRDRGSRKS